MDSKSKLGSDELPGTRMEDSKVIVRDNEWLLGIFDKN